MKIVSLDHVQLAMPTGDEHKAREFYVNVLGMSEIEKPANLKLRGRCWFKSNNAFVHLGVEKDFKPAKKAHPAFIVEDFETAIKKLKEHNVEIKDDEPLEGYHRTYISDPFGNRIEIMQVIN